MSRGEKSFTALLTVVVVLLLSACIWVYWGEDREPPVITVDKSKIHYDGSTSSLLKDVIAVDHEDGSVRVTVEKIEDQGKDTILVTYMAMDTAGNQSRVSEIIERNAEDEEEEAEINAEPETESEQETSEEVVPEEAVPEDAETQPETEAVNPAVPVLTLVETEAVISTEEEFNYFNYIENVTDDVDDYDTLTRRIHVSGVQETYAPGQYQITYEVIDTDGNVSSPVILNLTVQ